MKTLLVAAEGAFDDRRSTCRVTDRRRHRAHEALGVAGEIARRAVDEIGIAERRIGMRDDERAHSHGGEDPAAVTDGYVDRDEDGVADCQHIVEFLDESQPLDLRLVDDGGENPIGRRPAPGKHDAKAAGAPTLAQEWEHLVHQKMERRARTETGELPEEKK